MIAHLPSFGFIRIALKKSQAQQKNSDVFLSML